MSPFRIGFVGTWACWWPTGGVKHGLAILLVLAMVLVVLGLALLAIIPVFADQIGDLITAAPGILQDTLRNPQVNSLNDRFQRSWSRSWTSSR